jgi:hypothetical protein
MLTRLLKEECEEIVMGYEAYRNALVLELERRSYQATYAANHPMGGARMGGAPGGVTNSKSKTCFIWYL